jgi:hypothetical protein
VAQALLEHMATTTHYARSPRSRLQPAHHRLTLCEQRGDLGDVDYGRVRLVQVSAELLERRSLELAIAFLGVQLDERAGLGEPGETRNRGESNPRCA